MTLPKYVLYLFCTAPGRRWMGRPPRLRGGAEAAPLNLWSSATLYPARPLPARAYRNKRRPQTAPPSPTPPLPELTNRSGDPALAHRALIFTLCSSLSALGGIYLQNRASPPAHCVEMLTCINGRSLCFSFGERTAA